MEENVKLEIQKQPKETQEQLLKRLRAEQQELIESLKKQMETADK